jgi:hypothetical protein
MSQGHDDGEEAEGVSVYNNGWVAVKPEDVNGGMGGKPMSTEWLRSSPAMLKLGMPCPEGWQV